MTIILWNNRDVVQKIGEHEGPQTISIATDHLKPWINDGDGSLSEDSDSDYENIQGQLY